MKTCGNEKRIQQYLDGELSGEALRAFSEHLEECQQCREKVEQFRGLLAGLRALPVPEVPQALHDRLHAALSSEIQKGSGAVKRKLNPWAITAAAALVVCVALGGLWAGGVGITNRDMAHNNIAQSTSMGGEPAAGELEDRAPVNAPTSAPMPTMAPAAVAPGANFSAAKDAADNTGAGAASAQQSSDQLTKAPNGLKIIYTANVVLETRDYTVCVTGIQSLMAKYSGYTESSQETGVPEDTQGTGRMASVTMRIPIDNYKLAMSDIKTLGNVLQNTESTQDVSAQYVNTKARRDTLDGEIEKLQDLLKNKATTMENIIALQNQITSLISEEEQLTAQLNFWQDKVSYSTITVEVRELVTPKSVKTTDPDLGTRSSGALYGTLNAMKKAMENIAVGFMGFLPWLIFIVAVLAVVAAVAVPIIMKRRKANKNKTAPKADGEEQK